MAIIRRLKTGAHLAAAIAIVALITRIVAPPSAEAHEFVPERQVMMQVFPEHVDLVILYIEAPGERTGLFGAQFGFVKDEPQGPLADLAQRAMLPRMLDGLTFEVKGERPVAGEPEMRLQKQQGRIMAAAFVRYELSPLQQGQEREVFVRSRERSFLPTEVQIYSGGSLTRTDGHDEELITTMDRDQELRATFTLVEGKK